MGVVVGVSGHQRLTKLGTAAQKQRKIDKTAVRPNIPALPVRPRRKHGKVQNSSQRFSPLFRGFALSIFRDSLFAFLLDPFPDSL